MLADLSPELLATARANVEDAGVATMVEEIVEADARDLSRWADGSFDAVLALGPFYHLQDAQERRQAAREAARVLPPGGVAFAAMVTRYSLLRRTLLHPDERCRLADPGFLMGLLERGLYDNEMAGRFTGAYAVRPTEVVSLFEAQGFAGVALLSCESIAVELQPTLVHLAAESEAAYQAVMDAVAEAASDPSVLGLAGHLLYVGRKR